MQTVYRIGDLVKRTPFTRLSVIRSHRDQWRALVSKVENVRDALELDEPDAIKALKVYAETLKIIHEGERKAWGIDEESLRPAPKAPSLELLCGETPVELPTEDTPDTPAPTVREDPES